MTIIDSSKIRSVQQPKAGPSKARAEDPGMAPAGSSEGSGGTGQSFAALSPRRELQTAERALTLVLCLAFVTLLVFLPVLSFEFVIYDDPGYVSQNPHVITGLSQANVMWAFSTLHGEISYWHPITWISHQLDCTFFRLSPGAHHLTNVLLHSVSGILLFRFLYETTHRLACSFAVALLFCIHPLHVESVAWIAERKDVLSGMFWMATLNVYVSYVKRRTRGYYLTTLVLFACGLLSKPSVVVLPCTLLLVDFWPLQRLQGLTGQRRSKTFSVLLMEKIPFFILSLIGSVVTIAAQKSIGAIASIQAVPMSDRIDNALVSYFLYLKKTFWPTNLAVIYAKNDSWPFWFVLLAGIVLTLITFAAIQQRRSRPFVLMGWFWFLGVLFPMIGIIQVGGQYMADRYTYISLIGILIALVFGFVELAERWRVSQFVKITVVAACIAPLVVCTRRQLAHWQDSVSLFAHAVQSTPGNWLALHNYGMALAQAGRYSEADEAFVRALARSSPDNTTVLRSRGNIHLDLGNPAAALEYFRKTVALDPEDLDAHHNLAEIYSSARDPALRDGVLAVRHASFVCQRRRVANYQDLDVLAAAYAETGDFQQAISTAERAATLASVAHIQDKELYTRLTLYKDHKAFTREFSRRKNTRPVVISSE